ncbi:MAG: metallophosphoesterase family protein, partial [Chloroflexi bacterium]|nr:metallophosphoesterase family protein [Chloroflexota bacterium]
MKRIGLITDTHIPNVEKALPVEACRALEGMDLILHAGDIYSMQVLDDLEKIAPCLAALGDDDEPTALQDPRVKQKHHLNIEGVAILLVHEPPYSLMSHLRGNNGPAEHPSVVVHGHEHSVTNVARHGIQWVNSGSPTFLHYKRGPGTVGVLTVD